MRPVTTLLILLLQFLALQAQQLIEVPKDLLGRDFVVAARVEKVSRDWWMVKKHICPGVRMYDPQLVRFSVRNDSLVITTIDKIFKPEPITLPIASKQGDSYLVDLAPFFLQIQKGLDILSGKSQPGTLTESKIDMMRGNIRHLEVRINHTYSEPKPTQIPDSTSSPPSKQWDQEGLFSNPYSLSLRKSLLLLPEPPMQRRPADPRLSFKDNEHPYINRFRLDKDTTILFHIDDSFPKLWQDAIRQGIEDWNIAFQTIGHPNLLKAITFSESGSNFDPFDITSNTFFRVESQQANAEGRHWIDPRSGEILQADVLFYSNVITKLKSWLFLQTAAYNPVVRNEISDTLVFHLIRYAAAHEIGHCLGLEHNFRASHAYRTEDLRDPSFCGTGSRLPRTIKPAVPTTQPIVRSSTSIRPIPAVSIARPVAVYCPTIPKYRHPTSVMMHWPPHVTVLPTCSTLSHISTNGVSLMIPKRVFLARPTPSRTSQPPASTSNISISTCWSTSCPSDTTPKCVPSLSSSSAKDTSSSNIPAPTPSSKK